MPTQLPVYLTKSLAICMQCFSESQDPSLTTTRMQNTQFFALLYLHVLFSQAAPSTVATTNPLLPSTNITSSTILSHNNTLADAFEVKFTFPDHNAFAYDLYFDDTPIIPSTFSAVLFFAELQLTADIRSRGSGAILSDQDIRITIPGCWLTAGKSSSPPDPPVEKLTYGLLMEVVKRLQTTTQSRSFVHFVNIFEGSDGTGEEIGFLYADDHRPSGWDPDSSVY